MGADAERRTKLWLMWRISWACSVAIYGVSLIWTESDTFEAIGVTLFAISLTWGAMMYAASTAGWSSPRTRADLAIDAILVLVGTSIAGLHALL